MKQIFTLLMTLTILVSSNTQAQTTYNIKANGKWSALLPATCANCTIDISSGVVLTLDGSYTCQNCTFQGGTLSMTNQTLNIQYSGNSAVTTYFKGTSFLIYGNSSKVVVNAPLSISNATFTFNDGSSFTTSYEDDLTASVIYLYDNATMVSTGSASVAINLISSSKIVIGSGSQTSSSSFTVSGPTLTLYDNSVVSVANDNNVYYDWSNYKYAASTSASSSSTKSYSTSSSTMNCGGAYPHACSNPYLYGPVTLTAQGPVSGSTLPVVLVGFSALMNSDNTVTLNWDTQEEVNFSHFEIERSQDGNVWNTIGTLLAKGNSSTVTNYTFTDETPAAGTNYYRLKVVDLDDASGYTEIKVIGAALVSKVSFYPNPARDYVNVTLGETAGLKVTIRLINQSGQVLQEKTATAGNGTIVSLPLQQVASGLYILSVSAADGTRANGKLLISKL